MYVLVLGGNGFIGSHVVDALLLAGHHVRVFGRRPGSGHERLESVQYYFGEFSDTHKLSEALNGIDVVIHLISATVPSTSNLDPIADVQNNLINTLQLLQLMVSVDVKRIIYTSSGGTVYGNPTTLPVPEDHPLNPISSYGVVKVSIEKYLGMFEHDYGLQPLVLRPSNPFGPRQRHDGTQGVISTFMKRMMQGEAISVWGDGSIKRDYLYVADLAELVCKAVASSYCGVVNAGAGIAVSLNELISVMENVIEKKAKINYLPGRSFDVKEVVLNVSRASCELGWKPRTSLESGIMQQYNWMIAIASGFQSGG